MKATRIVLICVLVIASVVLAFMNVQSVVTPIHFDGKRDAREVAVKEHLIDIREALAQYHHKYDKYTDNPDSLVYFLKNTPIQWVNREKSLTDDHLENLKLSEEKVVKILEKAKKDALKASQKKNAKMNFYKEDGSLDLDSLYRYIWAYDNNVKNNKLQDFRRDTMEVNMIDSLFHGRYTAETIDKLVIIPYSKGDSVKFQFRTSSYYTAQGDVPLYEVMAPYEEYLWDLDKQELANLIDKEARKEIKRIDPDNYQNLKPSDVKVGLKVGDVDAPNGGHGNWE